MNVESYPTTPELTRQNAKKPYSPPEVVKRMQLNDNVITITLTSESEELRLLKINTYPNGTYYRVVRVSKNDKREKEMVLGTYLVSEKFGLHKPYIVEELTMTVNGKPVTNLMKLVLESKAEEKIQTYINPNVYEHENEARFT